MASRVMVKGKHQITVRLAEDDYRVLSHWAAYRGDTVNKLMAAVTLDYARDDLERRGVDVSRL